MPTNHELSQLQYLWLEIRDDRERLEKLKAKATAMTSAATGMPHGGGISDKTGIAAAIADLSREIELKMHKAVELETVLTRYIGDIDDSYMRLLLTYRYIRGWSWDKIAIKLGGGNTAVSVRQTVSRFIKQTKVVTNVTQDVL